MYEIVRALFCAGRDGQLRVRLCPSSSSCPCPFGTLDSRSFGAVCRLRPAPCGVRPGCGSSARLCRTGPRLQSPEMDTCSRTPGPWFCLPRIAFILRVLSGVSVHIPAYCPGTWSVSFPQSKAVTWACPLARPSPTDLTLHHLNTHSVFLSGPPPLFRCHLSEAPSPCQAP
jgi:hypothetical protein